MKREEKESEREKNRENCSICTKVFLTKKMWRNWMNFACLNDHVWKTTRNNADSYKIETKTKQRKRLEVLKMKIKQKQQKKLTKRCCKEIDKNNV